MKRIVPMKVELCRDNAGFWMALIEEDAITPEGRGGSASCRRLMLPVPPYASRAEAEAAFRRVMFHESRRPNGRR